MLRTTPPPDGICFVLKLSDFGSNDLTSCRAEEVIERLTEVQRMATTQPRESVLTLGDLTEHRVD